VRIGAAKSNSWRVFLVNAGDKRRQRVEISCRMIADQMDGPRPEQHE
jgi:hypothetical protein